MVTVKRARITGIIMLAVIFAVGALSGAATMRVVNGEDAPKLKRVQQEPRLNLLDRLDLTPEQRQEAEQILERRRAEMEAFWEEHRPALRAITDSARAELRAILTPEQVEIEKRFMEERRAHMERRDRERRDSNQW
jgi:Spy/CpxP family protein refolding chaperone